MKLLIGLFILSACSLSFASEKRCGWISNPTPANMGISDAAGYWVIGVQGGYQSDGIDNLSFPDSDGDKYVRTNGYYGYFCGCITAETSVNNNGKHILSTQSESFTLWFS